MVVDGYCRDVDRLIGMRFPTYSAGILCSDSLGRLDVTGVQVPIECGGVKVSPNDVVLADYDGIVVIPQDAALEVVALAEEKVKGEGTVRADLLKGRPVWEAFREHGVI